MAETALKIENCVGGRACANCDSNSESREKLDQKDLDELLESVNRLKLIGRTLWEFETFDKEERGTVAIMLNREAEQIFATMENLSARLGA
jgi:lipoate synthase